MRRPALVILAVVAAITLLLPVATSAGRSLAVTTPAPPTPAAVAGATPTPGGNDVVCVDLSTVNDAAQYPQGGLGLAEAGVAPDPQAVEVFRQDLTAFLDELDALSDTLPSHSVYRSDAKYGLAQAREYFQHLTPAQLYTLQGAFKEVGTDLESLTGNVESVKLQALADFQTSDETDTEPEPAPKASTESGPAPNSFPVIPTPTPDTRGIVHDNATQNALNDQLGDLFPPGWPTDVGCPAMGYSTEVLFGMMVAVDALKAVQIGLDTWCKEKTVTCPGSDPQDPIACWIAAASKFVLNVTEDVRAGFVYCNGNATSARIEAIWKDTRLLHKELYEHDQSLIERSVTDDQFLYDFRNLNLRLNVEADLAAPTDNPELFLALPRRFCVSDELEELTADPNNASYDPFAPDALAGCGLLEIVSDTVKSAIDMVKGANLSVNNAETEYQAALVHYQNQEWRLAFDRFRKAYREAVKP